MRLTRWNKETTPSPEALRSALTGEGYHVSEWSDPPGTVYPVHAHEHAEVRWVVQGQMRVGLPESGEEFVLTPGDRLEVPPNALHWVDVDALAPVLYFVGTKSRNGHKRP